MRTWILKEEVNDINIMMEEHKKAWKQYGDSIIVGKIKLYQLVLLRQKLRNVASELIHITV